MPSTKTSNLDGRADDVRVDVCVDVANRVTRVAGGTREGPSTHVYEGECGHEPVTTLAAPAMPMRQAPSPHQTVPRSVSGYVPYDASMSNGIVINEALKRLSQFGDRGDSFSKRGSRFAKTSKTVYPDNRNIPGKGMTTDDAVMSSVWLQSHLNSESKKIKWHHFFRLWNEYRLLPISGCIIFVWLLAGTLFYKYNAKFRSSQAFYFTVQSGFSVGFGVKGVMANDAADPELARWYTVFHILIGSSLIVGALSLWGSIIVSASHSHQRELEQVFRRHHLRTSVGSLAPASPDGTISTNITSKFPSIYLDGEDDDEEEETMVDADPLRNDKKFTILLGIVFLIYLSAGVTFGMVHLHWVFSEALLYTVAALSTGGLVAPDSDDCSMWFTGFYVLFGVPFYGYVLASAAGFLEERTRLAMKREEIAHGFNSRDRDMLRSLRVFDAGQNGQQARGIAWHQFLSLYLIKLNLACEDDIKAIRQKFEEMNVDNDKKEEITIFDVNTELVFRTFDPKSWGHIDFKGFVGLCVVLISRNVRASETMVDMTASEIRKISLDDVVKQESFLKDYIFSKARCRRLYEHFATAVVVVRRNRVTDGRPQHVLTRRGVLNFLQWYDKRSIGGHHELEEWEKLEAISPLEGDTVDETKVTTSHV